MKNRTDQATLEKVFQVPARLRIMSVLMVKKSVDFSELIETLELTRGNLSVHMKLLSEMEYVTIDKKFVGNRPKTTYSITLKGRTDFQNYVSILENIINPTKGI